MGRLDRFTLMGYSAYHRMRGLLGRGERGLTVYTSVRKRYAWNWGRRAFCPSGKAGSRRGRRNVSAVPREMYGLPFFDEVLARKP